MSKRSAFSRKCEQRHWRLRHDHEEMERQHKRVQKCQRKTTADHDSHHLAAHADDEPDPETAT